MTGKNTQFAFNTGQSNEFCVTGKNRLFRIDDIYFQSFH